MRGSVVEGSRNCHRPRNLKDNKHCQAFSPQGARDLTESVGGEGKTAHHKTSPDWKKKWVCRASQNKNEVYGHAIKDREDWKHQGKSRIRKKNEGGDTVPRGRRDFAK